MPQHSGGPGGLISQTRNRGIREPGAQLVGRSGLEPDIPGSSSKVALPPSSSGLQGGGWGHGTPPSVEVPTLSAPGSPAGSHHCTDICELHQQPSKVLACSSCLWPSDGVPAPMIRVLTQRPQSQGAPSMSPDPPSSPGTLFQAERLSPGFPEAAHPGQCHQHLPAGSAPLLTCSPRAPNSACFRCLSGDF